MRETRPEIFQRLKAELLAPHDDIIELPSIVAAVEFRREQYGLWREEWAVLLGMASSHYSEFANGKRGLPHEAAARAFRLGVPPECLLQMARPLEFKPRSKMRNPPRNKTPEQLREYNKKAKRRSRERADTSSGTREEK